MDIIPRIPVKAVDSRALLDFWELDGIVCVWLQNYRDNAASGFKVQLPEDWTVCVKVHRVKVDGGTETFWITDHSAASPLLFFCLICSQGLYVSGAAVRVVGKTKTRKMQHGKEEQDSAGTGTSAARTTGRRKNTAVIYVTFLILTLDLSMMFLQFSVTPVSMWRQKGKLKCPCRQWTPPNVQGWCEDVFFVFLAAFFIKVRTVM